MGRWYGKVIDHDHVHSTPAHSQIHIRRLLIGKNSAKQNLHIRMTPKEDESFVSDILFLCKNFHLHSWNDFDIERA